MIYDFLFQVDMKKNNKITKTLKYIENIEFHLIKFVEYIIKLISIIQVYLLLSEELLLH